MAGSIAFISLLIGTGIFLCLRRRSNKRTRRPPIDLGADEPIETRRRPTPSIFSPFEYQTSSSPGGVSDYSRSTSAGARITSSPSSQALLFAFDSTAPSNNHQSTYSMYSRDDTTTSSATQWGARLPASSSAVVPYPQSPTPSVPPVRERRPLVMISGPEGASGPVAVNRLPSDAPSPPPYTAR